ncbi:MAG TPA: lipopolysaccharide biosynthesis protein [Agriterribacter sp.]|nr:lipopolysaccharide biosynthesis protein [Chitinophagaceae bacterium]HRP31124.1 lipopolysaccharide biosynthesis protein [Agriterribacter sp.]
MSIKEKTISGIIWTLAQQTGVQGVNFLVQLCLARILLPEAFGLIAIVQIFIAIGNALMDGGMTASLIRMEKPDQRDFSTVFFINLLSSIVFYLILFIAAPYISEFFKQPLLTPIIRIYPISFVIQALVGVQTAKLTKEMNFKLQMYMQIPATFCGGLVGLLLAYTGAGVWSLVWMQLTTAFLFMIQHWFRTNWRPSFIIDREKLRFHFNFGYKLTLSSLITSIYIHSYTLIIGKLYSATQLGYFNQANTLRMFPVTNITIALQKVTYPVFSSLQHNNEKLKQAFKKITSLVFFIICPVMMSLILLASPLFRFALTEKWLPAVPYFQILCISAIVYPHSLYNLNIVLAKGRSDLHFKLELLKKGSSVLFFLLIIPFGIWGVVYASALSMFIQAFINALYSGRMINYSFRSQVLDIMPTVLIATSSMFIVYFLQVFMDSVANTGDLTKIIFGLFAYFLFYIFMSYFFRIQSMEEMKIIALQLLKKIKKT